MFNHGIAWNSGAISRLTHASRPELTPIDADLVTLIRRLRGGTDGHMQQIAKRRRMLPCAEPCPQRSGEPLLLRCSNALKLF